MRMAPHSVRISAAVLAVESGADALLVMDYGSWATARVLLGYCRPSGYWQILPAIRGAGLASGGRDGDGGDVGARRPASIPDAAQQISRAIAALGLSTTVMKVVSCTVRMLKLEQCVEIDGA